MDPTSTTGVRLMVFDRTCHGAWPRPGLSHAWHAGAYLYRGLRRLDAWAGVASWSEALRFLATSHPGRTIAEIQYWGHGKWGSARVGGETFDVDGLTRDHRWASDLLRIRERMQGSSSACPSQWWFRTCETFGATEGQRFAQEFSNAMRCVTAGHTYVIGYWQSGLHTIRPGETPAWSTDEGLLQGTPDAPGRAKTSGIREPNTVSCLHGRVPTNV